MKKSQVINTKKILDNTGLKVTRDRLEILEALVETCRPMAVEDIVVKTKGVNQVTVYRFLKKLVSLGIISQTDFRQNKVYYEFQTHHHHHITCKKCNRREEVKMCLPVDYLKQLNNQAKNFSKISEHLLEFFGLCNNCQKG